MRGQCGATIAVIVWLFSVLAAPLGAVEFPGPSPGPAKAAFDGKRLTMANAVLSATFEATPRGLVLVEVTDRISHVTLRGNPNLMLCPRLAAKEAETRPVGAAILGRLPANPGALRAGERSAGYRAVAQFQFRDPAVRVQWRVTLRDQSNYIHQEVIVQAEAGSLPADQLTLLRLTAPGATVSGPVDGSPVVSGNLFFACEHPMAVNRVTGSEIDCSVGTFRPLRSGESCTRSCVVGVAPAGQMRRAFLHYLERERPRPYRPFLHYNSWYDIAWVDRKMNEAQCLAVIELFGRELIEKRGVKLDSAVFDDGWDDNRSLWRFHSDFPRGFTPLREAATRYGTAVGVWLSPFGGYAQAREERLKYGKTQGFETNRAGFSLAGPNYYARFREVCAAMIEKYGVNYFKFDGIAQGIFSTGAGREFAADVDGLLRLMADLRRLRADLFVNVTTGTWPSPFWLFWGDSIWRNGNDMGFFGPGSARQQWITYRDLYTYRGVVRRAALYPLNSLMNQGICHARLGYPAKFNADLKDMADEMRSFFGTGTQLQELYITPQMLTPAMWDLLAEGAAWSRKNADVLADTHWIGGDPAKPEIYGYAAWSPRMGIVTLSNPSSAAATFLLDVGRVFELPAGASQQYRLKSPWKDQASRPERMVQAGRPESLRLAPFEVLMFEATPVR
jgi:hypothetical protein